MKILRVKLLPLWGIRFFNLRTITLEQILVKNPTQFAMILSLQESFKTFKDLLKFFGSWKILKDLKNLEDYLQDLVTFS